MQGYVSADRLHSGYVGGKIFFALALITVTICRAALAWLIALKFALARGIAQSPIFLRNRWSEKGVGVLRGKLVFRASPCSADSSRYRWNSRNRSNLHFSTREDRYVLYFLILQPIENYPPSWLPTILFSRYAGCGKRAMRNIVQGCIATCGRWQYKSVDKISWM